MVGRKQHDTSCLTVALRRRARVELLIENDRLVFTVDGEPVPGAEAKAILTLP